MSWTKNNLSLWTCATILGFCGVLITILIFSHADHTALNQSNVNIIATEKVKEIVHSNLAGAEEELGLYEKTPLTTADTPWKLMHDLLARGHDFEIDSSNDQSISCVKWLLEEASWQPLFRGVAIVVTTSQGPAFRRAPSPAQPMLFEDHFCQFLFALHELHLDPDRTTVRVPPDGRRVTLRDFVRVQQKLCDSTNETSWAIPLFHAWAGERSWSNRYGQVIDLDKLVDQHLNNELAMPACFGTHWKYGLAYAVSSVTFNKNAMLARAQTRLAACLSNARASLDPVGRFDTKFMMSQGIPDIDSDVSSRISYQGHTLEWILTAIPDNSILAQEWVHIAVKSLLIDLKESRSKVEFGGYSHAIHALRIYQSRMKQLFKDDQTEDNRKKSVQLAD